MPEITAAPTATHGRPAAKLIAGSEAVAFDLDGTLVDTVPDLGAAANMMLLILGARPLAEEHMAAFVGGGIDAFVAKVVAASRANADPAQLAGANALFRNLYGQRLFERSRVYAHVPETLRALQDLDRKLYCVTNKESRFALPLLRLAGLNDGFAAVLCADRLEDRKPSPNLLLAACDHARVHPSRMLFVGDSAADVGAARAAGCRVLAVNSGYGAAPLAQLQPDAIVGSFGEILGLGAGPQHDCHTLRAIA